MRWLFRWLGRHRAPVLLVLGLVGAVVVRRHRAGNVVPVAQPTPSRPIIPRSEPASTPKQAAPSTVAVVAGTPAPVPPPPEDVASPAGGEPGPYPGSALALADGSAPSEEYTVKAKDATKRCHGPQSPYFGRTRADLWFRTEADAEAAGFTPWRPTRS